MLHCLRSPRLSLCVPLRFALPRLLLFSLVLLLLAGCAKQVPVEAKKESAPVVRVAPVTTKTVTRTVESVGTFFAYDEAIISAEVDGKVEEVKIDLGDQVSAGQLLVRISDEEQRYLLAQQEAQLRQSLEKLGLKDEKDRVQDIRQTPDVRRAAADLFEAEQRYKRVRSLTEQGIGSQSDMDQAQARFRSAEAALDATINQTRNVIQEVERFKATLDLQRKKVRDTTVRAPFAGAVKERQVTAGQFVRANTPLLTLIKVDPIRFRLEVPERMAPWIKTGQVARITTEAFERTFEGKIWRISPTVDQTKRTFVVEALVANADAGLKPGSYARARVPTQKTEAVLMVPNRGVSYVLGSNKAFIIRNNVVEARDVKLGDRFENEVEIVDGLQEGDQIAVTNLGRLDTGARVQIATGAEEKKGRKTAAETKGSE